MGTHCRVGSHRADSFDAGFFGRYGHTRVPALVQWMATLDCRLSCSHCLSAPHEGSMPDMPLETVLGLVDQVAAMSVPEFLITGGEPLERDDLVEVIGWIGRKGVPWSLNTARMPSLKQREVIRRNPPGFVAVSLDGPMAIHDAFRGTPGCFEEALDSIGWFASIGVEVCAGTTVTSRNLPHLGETFGIVAASGADRWGIHMLVPEGRAGQRRDLFPSRRDLRRLIGFVARKRRLFRVEMADEIGYLGDLEPLVRDRPLLCGAGRSQCVVIPDGGVVPCTTLDADFSAGNVNSTPLADIWREGFAALRSWKPAGECGGCGYAPACRGGCWLQRKAGTECSRDVWHVPGMPRTAAGLAVCLGLAALPEAECAPASPSASVVVDAGDARISEMELAVRDFCVSHLIGRDPADFDASSRGLDPDDPGCTFFVSFARNELPPGIADRCRMVSSALATDYRSLSLVAAMWRTVAEPFLEGDDYRNGLDGETAEMMAGVLEGLSARAAEWRQENLRQNLAAFLERSSAVSPPFFMMSKAGPRPGETEAYELTGDLLEERLQGIESLGGSEITREYIREHPFAADMALSFESVAGSVEIVSLSGLDGVSAIGPFDLLRPDGQVELTILLPCLLGAPTDTEFLCDSRDHPEDRSDSMEIRLSVELDAGSTYTYTGLLRELFDQNRGELTELALNLLSGYPAYGDEGSGRQPVIAVTANEAVLLPAIRHVLGSDIDDLCPEMPQQYRYNVRNRALMMESDFWMF